MAHPDGPFVESPTMKNLVPTSLLPLLLLVIGLRKSLREAVPYNVHVFKGSREHIVRDVWFIGTAFSPPPPVLVLHAGALVWMLLKPGPAVANVLERSASAASSAPWPKSLSGNRSVIPTERQRRCWQA